MPRPSRAAAGGFTDHAVNRANRRMRIFRKDEDYQAFEDILASAVERTGTRLLAYYLMPDPKKGPDPFMLYVPRILLPLS